MKFHLELLLWTSTFAPVVKNDSPLTTIAGKVPLSAFFTTSWRAAFVPPKYTIALPAGTFIQTAGLSVALHASVSVQLAGLLAALHASKKDCFLELLQQSANTIAGNVTITSQKLEHDEQF